MPVLEDLGPALEALDQQAALVVGGEVHRADHAVAPPLAQPGLGGREQGVRRPRWSSSHSKKPNRPQSLSWNSLKPAVDVRGDPPDRLAVAPGQEVLGLRVQEEGVVLAVQMPLALRDQGRHPAGLVTIKPPGELDEAHQVALRAHWPDLHGHGAAPYPNANGNRSLREGTQPRAGRAAARWRASRTCFPTSACSTGPAGPVVQMEGAERVMLGSNNYLGLTGDARVKQAARDALDTLRHRADRLAPPERHDPAAPGARARDRRVDGHRRRDRLHHRLPGQRRLPQHAARARRHRDLRQRRPRLDHGRRGDVPGPHPPLPPQPRGQARADARARGGRRRRRARGDRRRLLDGGRRLRPPADRRGLPASTAPA